MRLKQDSRHFTSADNDNTGVLDLSNKRFTDEDMPELVSFLDAHPKIQAVNLSNNFISDDGAEWLSNNKTIKKLDLSYNILSDQGIYFISLIQQIEYLNASCNYLRNTHLSISPLRLGPLSAQYLSNHQNIQVLMMNSNNLRNEGATYLAKSKNIKHLEISDNNIDDSGIEPFTENSYIHTLNVNDNEITDIGAIKLKKNTNLHHLHLNNNNIGDTGTIALTTMPQLETLSLQSNKRIKEPGIHAAATSKTLKILNIGSNELTEKSAKTLMSNTTLDRLGVENCADIEDSIYKILSTKDPMLCANYGKEAGLKTEVPSLKMLSLFAVKKPGICGYQFSSRVPNNNALQKLKHSYYILTDFRLYFYDGFQKNLKHIPLTEVQYNNLVEEICNEEHGNSNKNRLFKHREQLSAEKLQDIMHITKHSPPSVPSIVNELGITKTPEVKYFS